VSARQCRQVGGIEDERREGGRGHLVQHATATAVLARSGPHRLERSVDTAVGEREIRLGFGEFGSVGLPSG
jgi:hypothetical protein